MFRKKFADMFVTQQGLVDRAKSAHQSLISDEVKPREIPRNIFQLGDLYRKILDHDRASLQKRLQHADNDARQDEAIALLTAINKLLNCKFLDVNEIDALSPCNLPEGQHFNACAAFIRESKAYANEIKRYLLDMKDDIASTTWKIVEKYPMRQADNFLPGSSDESEEESSDEDNFFVFSQAHLEYTGDYAWKWAKDVPGWVRSIRHELEDLDADSPTSTYEILRTYENVLRHMKARGADRMHRNTEEFYKHHVSEIDGLSYLLLKPVENRKSVRDGAKY